MIRTVVLGFVISAALCLAPAMADTGVDADVVYGHKDGMALTYDVYRPASPNGAAVLFMVSGGWVSRWAPPEQFTGLFSPLLDKGYTVYSVRHGSSPRYKVPEAYADVTRALRHVKANAETYDIDPERIGVFGYSAGGHLSLMLGTTADSGNPESTDPVEKIPSGVKAVVAFFPPVDLQPIVGPNDRFPALDFDSELADDVSPLLHVTEDDPPTLLLHGDMDELVPLSNSERMHAALKEQGVATDMIVFEGEGHGFQKPEARNRSVEALTAWFEEHLGGE